MTGKQLRANFAGGKRPGAGRKPKPGIKRKPTVTLDADVWSVVDYLAFLHGDSLAGYIERLILQDTHGVNGETHLLPLTSIEQVVDWLADQIGHKDIVIDDSDAKDYPPLYILTTRDGKLLAQATIKRDQAAVVINHN